MHGIYDTFDDLLQRGN